jgi:hypothetical protein
MTLYIIRGDTVTAHASVPGGASADARPVHADADLRTARPRSKPHQRNNLVSRSSRAMRYKSS